MFLLDGAFKNTVLTEDDVKRMKYIASLLQAWGLVKIVNPQPQAYEKINVRVINYGEKSQWVLKQKYDMGKNVKREEE